MSIYINRYKLSPFNKRLKESSLMTKKHSDKCAIIIGKLDTDVSLPNINKNKYLVPFDFTIAQFMYLIRKNIKLSSEQALFLFIDSNIITSQSKIGIIHEKYKNDDGFLYITYAGENTFG